MARKVKKESEKNVESTTKSGVREEKAEVRSASTKKNATKKDIKKETVKSKAIANTKKDNTTKSAKENKKKANSTKTKKAEEKKSLKKAVSSKTEKKESTSMTVKSSAKTSSTTTKKAPAKRVASSKKAVTSKTSSKSTAKAMLAEYYDLPYGYNETTVKILAQTPTTLFVYWDISEEDRNSLISKYGDNFFYESKPILIVHNKTKNYSFEIEINDFANSWYIRCQEPNCDYAIELGRKLVERPEEYIYIDSSNDIISPNDHILFESSDLGHVRYRNIKTGTISEKDYGSLRFINNIDKLYGNIYDVYTALYNKETLNELTNPSSGEFILR